MTEITIDPRFNSNPVYSKSKRSYPCNRLWRPIGLWDVEDPTLSSLPTDGSKVASLRCYTPQKHMFMWGTLSDERTGLEFAVQSLNCPSCTEPVNHTLLSHLRIHKPAGPGCHICIPQEQGGPVIPLGTGFPLHPLLPFARDYHTAH
jgi:hypothetical protein